MTRDDIVRIVQEAGFQVLRGGVPPYKLHVMNIDHMERFAALVAAAEREECAKLIEQMGIEEYGTLAIAAAVRARGQQ